MTGLILFLSLCLLGGASYYLSQGFLSRSQDETMAAIGAGGAEKVTRDVGIIVAQLEGISRNPVVREGKDAAGIVAVLSAEQKRLKGLANINCIFPDGAAIRANGTRTNVADRDYFKRVMESRQTAVSDVIVSGVTGKPSVIVAVPIMTDGRLMGMVSGSLPLENLAYIVNDIRYKESGFGFLADDAGMVLSNPKSPELVGKLKLTVKGIDPQLNCRWTSWTTGCWLFSGRLSTAAKRLSASTGKLTGSIIIRFSTGQPAWRAALDTGG
jgi:methyl-accepting chemotaxis protein